jgi:hypothetical protein
VTARGEPAERRRSLLEGVTLLLGHRDVPSALSYGMGAGPAEVSRIGAVRIEDASIRVKRGSRRGVFTA